VTGVPLRSGPVVPPRLGLARRIRRRWPLSIVLALVYLAIVGVVAVTGPLLAPQDPGAVGAAESLAEPSAAHLLGTDDLGRDVFSRVVAGARSSVGGPLAIASGVLLVATALALLAAYRGGWVDSVLGRVTDLIFSLPALLVAIVVVGVVGGGYAVAIAVLIVLNIPQNFRIIRAAALEQRVLPYVEAAECVGARPGRVMVRHLLPNVLGFVLACFCLRFTFAIVELSSLSFLGLGVPAGSADWGRMVSEYRLFLEVNPWASIGPVLALILTAASMNIVGDWVYDRVSRSGRGGA